MFETKLELTDLQEFSENKVVVDKVVPAVKVLVTVIPLVTVCCVPVQVKRSLAGCKQEFHLIYQLFAGKDWALVC